MITRLKFRHGTTAEWAAFNPTLADGEPGYDSDLKRMKIGDGVQPWSALNYVTVDSDALTALVNQVDAAVVQAQAAAASAQGTTGREVAGGVAGLDATGKLYETRIPDRLSQASIAQIYNRANHTGTQPSSTLSDITLFGQQVIQTASAAALKGTLQVNLVDNVPDLSKPVSVAQNQAIQAARVAAETAAENRLNHTGTQAASTINDFEATVVSLLTKYGVTFTTPGGTTGGGTPPPPTGTGAPLNVRAVPQSDGSIQVLWDVPTTLPSGKTIAGYLPYRDQPDWTNPTPVPYSSSGFNLTNFSTTTTYTIGVSTAFTDGTTSPLASVSGISIAGSTPVVVTPPGGTTGSAPMAYPTHGIGMYHKLWADSSYPSVANTPANVNNLRLAFWFDPGPSLVGGSASGGSDGAQLGPRLQALRAKGVRIIGSLGGGGNTINLANRPGVVSALMNFSNNVCPLDGVDWDLEGGAMNSADVIAIMQSLRQQRGDLFAATFVPNGSYISQYITVVAAMKSAGVRYDAFGQQFYDTPVDDATMKNKIQQYVNGGLDITKYEVGMMNPSTSYAPDSYYWDTATQVARINSAKAAYPTLGGSYYWDASRGGQTAWATQVGGIIKTW